MTRPIAPELAARLRGPQPRNVHDQVRGPTVQQATSHTGEIYCDNCETHLVQVEGGICPCCWGER